ncbi:low affinity immunoglobulin epsilon Fc receptor-like [Mya arenaria]|uniref:low affinity immunoglobulin epsilon Fc receptor-like n=1 Tax=Mya arenaria TaxID=6604 RepID=UPI0022DEF120|nr:low affinity immunoglobulin epsilon Fc receptor-like [Mya arenaria]
MKAGFVFFLWLLLFEGFDCDCRDGWVKHGASCYYFSHDTETWIGATQICKALQGSLVTIESQQENDFLTSQIHTLKQEWYWIALCNLENEGTWVWMGEGKSTPAVYTTWDHGEPNNSDGNENCGILRKTSHWNDDVCHKPGVFICEKQDEMEIIG